MTTMRLTARTRRGSGVSATIENITVVVPAPAGGVERRSRIHATAVPPEYSGSPVMATINNVPVQLEIPPGATGLESWVDEFGGEVTVCATFPDGSKSVIKKVTLDQAFRGTASL